MEHIDSLILAFLNGVITHEEFEELKAWITAKEEHREYARKTIELWFSASVVADNTPHDAQSAYERFSKSVQSKDIEAEQPQGVSSSFNKLLWVGAAMIAIILLPLIGYLTGRNNVHNQFSSVRIVVPKGSENQIILPDGTQVRLNAGTSLTYSQGYGITDREVQLDGEGWFAVKHNSKIPFTVESDRVSLTDLGTEFRISNYKKDNLSYITLIDGRIRVENRILKSSTSSLRPGECMQINKYTGKITTTRKDFSLVNARSFNIIKFDDEPMESIAKCLERQYNVRIIVENKLKDKRFFATIDVKKNTLTDVLRLLQGTQRLRYEKQGDVYILYSN